MNTEIKHHNIEDHHPEPVQTLPQIIRQSLTPKISKEKTQQKNDMKKTRRYLKLWKHIVFLIISDTKKLILLTYRLPWYLNSIHLNLLGINHTTKGLSCTVQCYRINNEASRRVTTSRPTATPTTTTSSTIKTTTKPQEAKSRSDVIRTEDEDDLDELRRRAISVILKKYYSN